MQTIKMLINGRKTNEAYEFFATTFRALAFPSPWTL